jgi:hypothetical protein
LFVVALGALALGGAAQGRMRTMVHISGARLIGVDGRPLRLIGVNRSGTEYACAGPVDGGGFGYGIFQGPKRAGSAVTPTSTRATAESRTGRPSSAT